MPNITITLPGEVYAEWLIDPKSKGLIARLVAEHYGFAVNKSRVVKKPTVSS